MARERQAGESGASYLHYWFADSTFAVDEVVFSAIEHFQGELVIVEAQLFELRVRGEERVFVFGLEANALGARH